VLKVWSIVQNGEWGAAIAALLVCGACAGGLLRLPAEQALFRAASCLLTALRLRRGCPRLAFFPLPASRQGKTDFRSSATITRKHNAAVKAQQRAEREQLRAKARCARAHGCKIAAAVKL
jgi:hypothetical protein